MSVFGAHFGLTTPVRDSALQVALTLFSSGTVRITSAKCHMAEMNLRLVDGGERPHAEMRAALPVMGRPSGAGQAARGGQLTITVGSISRRRQ